MEHVPQFENQWSMLFLPSFHPTSLVPPLLPFPTTVRRFMARAKWGAAGSRPPDSRNGGESKSLIKGYKDVKGCPWRPELVIIAEWMSNTSSCFLMVVRHAGAMENNKVTWIENFEMYFYLILLNELLTNTTYNSQPLRLIFPFLFIFVFFYYNLSPTTIPPT